MFDQLFVRSDALTRYLSAPLVFSGLYCEVVSRTTLQTFTPKSI
jgi:hypothetical protein